jgi:DNA-directed RNA polymerase specialized sigma24 family protein
MSQSLQFPNTQWTLHCIATLHGDAAAGRALNDLCTSYRQPVYALYRSKGLSHENAEDLTQKLLLQLTRSRVWQSADRAKGRFRDYLHKIAVNAFYNFHRYSRAKSRNGGIAPESLDLLIENETAPPSAEGEDIRAFDREWAHSVIANTFQHMESDPAWSRYFPYARKLFPGNHTIPTYTEAAIGLGVLESSASKLIMRLRAQFAHSLRSEVRNTLSPGDNIDAEMAYLASILTHYPMPLPPENPPADQKT